MFTFAAILAFVKKHWIKFAIGAGVILVLFAGAVMYKRWTTPTLNIKESQEIQNGIRAGNAEQIKNGLAESDARVKVGVEEVARTDEEAKKVEEAAKEAKKDYDGS
jgi:uncharacterized membrane protein